VLVLVLLAEVASASASTGGEPINAFYAQTAMLLLLVSVIQPFRKHASWANPSLVTIFALLGLTGIIAKVHNPYSWNSFSSSPMFVNRQWYQHPTYGPMYMERDLLRFIEPVCREMAQAGSTPELLSLPYAYPNYFCATPPWHGYVQTYFDTSTRSTINRLMGELDTAPPQWIVYQRQQKILAGAEKIYNRGQPLAQRDLDEMIMRKMATGEWQLVDKSNYLVLDDKKRFSEDDGWLIIRTRP
jgi:hypothetical protein